jgi:Tol biopolymer transport system component
VWTEPEWGRRYRYAIVTLYSGGSEVALPGLNLAPNLGTYNVDPSISGNGRYIAFSSNRSRGAGGDDIYLYDSTTRSLIALPHLNSTADDMGQKLN